jgi:GTP cyclohydrolase I
MGRVGMPVAVVIITSPFSGVGALFALTTWSLRSSASYPLRSIGHSGKKPPRGDTKRRVEPIAHVHHESRIDQLERTEHAPPPAGAAVRLLPPDRSSRPLRGERAPLDPDRAERAVRELLGALGVDLTAEGLVNTPRRVVEAYRELLTPEPFRPTTFAAEGRDQLVAVSGIRFGSLCEHHLLPFSGVAHVGYVPGDRIIGLSKLARLVASCAAELQVQERLTAQIADRLVEILTPCGVGVVVEATHACMSLRGPCQPDATTRTSVLRGVLRDDPALRHEFLVQAVDRRVRT